MVGAEARPGGQGLLKVLFRDEAVAAVEAGLDRGKDAGFGSQHGRGGVDGLAGDAGDGSPVAAADDVGVASVEPGVEFDDVLGGQELVRELSDLGGGEAVIAPGGDGLEDVAAIEAGGLFGHPLGGGEMFVQLVAFGGGDSVRRGLALIAGSPGGLVKADAAEVFVPFVAQHSRVHGVGLGAAGPPGRDLASRGRVHAELGGEGVDLVFAAAHRCDRGARHAGDVGEAVDDLAPLASQASGELVPQFGGGEIAGGLGVREQGAAIHGAGGAVEGLDEVGDDGVDVQLGVEVA